MFGVDAMESRYHTASQSLARWCPVGAGGAVRGGHAKAQASSTLTDDVFDTALEAFDGPTCGLGSGPDIHGSLAHALGDGVNQDSDNAPPDANFPYLNALAPF
jgi:hypothetical protein